MDTCEQIIVVACADMHLRQKLCRSLQEMRWEVREASGGAAALAHLEECRPEALLLDSWLPDLETGALVDIVQQLYPKVDLLRLDCPASAQSLRSGRRHELLHAIREAESSTAMDGAIWGQRDRVKGERRAPSCCASLAGAGISADSQRHEAPRCITLLPGMVGDSEAMRELSRLVHLVAPHTARVLIEGETGVGKELVARAVHALSGRETKPFVAINCAAIPETLLEAELFGHTRGAFTGAVQSRLGRIEAANGGTLFLDEIGELPLALQSKLLRFLENGEIQRIGGNDAVQVDVRVVSATHQVLEDRAEKGTFRLDLYHRLAVFPVEVPPLRERMSDLSMLVQELLREFGRQAPCKRLSSLAFQRLMEHPWPGNVRELQNVLQRAVILAEGRVEICEGDLLFGRVLRS